MVCASARAAFALLVCTSVLWTGVGTFGASADSATTIGKLVGRWAGDGTMVPAQGRSEAFRCIIVYAAGEEASRIRQHLRCQGGETRLDAVTRLDIHNNRITGVWSESTYSLNGTVRGMATRDGFDIRLQSSFFNARMTVTATACEQSVKLVPEDVAGMKEMAAVLIKSDRARICDPARVIVPPVPVPAVRPNYLARQ
jgi:hypothetical protein